MPLDYSKTYIYKLCCRDVNITELYVGSTTNFNQRRRLHRSCCTNESSKNYNSNVYSFIRGHGGWSNWDMVLVDTVSASNRLEAHKAERGYIESLRAVLNKQTPASTRSETGRKYYQSHKEARSLYVEANREKIKGYLREYRETNREKNTEYQASYRAAHKDNAREYRKRYHQKRKQALQGDTELDRQEVHCRQSKSMGPSGSALAAASTRSPGEVSPSGPRQGATALQGPVLSQRAAADQEAPVEAII